MPYCVGRPEGYICSSAFHNGRAMGSEGDFFFLWISTVVSFCVVTCLFVALRLNLCMICGKKPLLMAVCFMMDNSSFL